MDDSQNRAKPMSWCVGCGQEIVERFFLGVFPDLAWHVRCLKCAECHQFLDQSRSCFLRDGQTFCREHRSRKCPKCHQAFNRKEFVMQAGANVYHMQCFQCEECNRPLLPGDKYVLLEGYPICSNHQNPFSESQTSESSVSIKSSPPCSSKQRRSENTTRNRTVLSSAQLRMLQTCYRANPRPDALMKEQLVEITGLNHRVIRVWFQNKRCKDKKRSLMMRLLQTEESHDSEEPFLLLGPEVQGAKTKISA